MQAQHELMKTTHNTLDRLLNEPTVSVPEAAHLLGIGRSTLYAAAKSGNIPAIRIGGRVRIPSIWLLQSLQILSADGGRED
ncbi:helix-turn-helix domain-containing protein [Nocardia aurantia]|uniref:helix-turn-helix domain-containing protein n=1 Tax=Nocardia aurantia TaxID=2585199 RepID=UPI003872ADF3